MLDSIAGNDKESSSSCDSIPFLSGADSVSDWENGENKSRYSMAQQTVFPRQVHSGIAPSVGQTFGTPFIVGTKPLPILPSSGLPHPVLQGNNTVPEFLYQLTKMLTGGHNNVIEWSNGRIEVHNPYKLQSTVLHKYFRHSKFASFQRQLNYFGFRKLAGKGKMAPCSYVNEAATSDIGSLLLIKRKTSTSISKDKEVRNGKANGTEKRKETSTVGSSSQDTNEQSNLFSLSDSSSGQRHSMALKHSINVSTNSAVGYQSQSQEEIAKAAVGKGVRHSCSIPFDSFQQDKSKVQHVAGSVDNKPMFSVGVEDCLSELTNNYKNSLVDSLYRNPGEHASGNAVLAVGGEEQSDLFPQVLSRDSSLVDLAMIPTLDDAEGSNANQDSGTGEFHGMRFVDFPQPEVHPAANRRPADTS